MPLPPADPEVVRRNGELMRALDGRMPYMANLGFRLLETGHGHARFLLPYGDAAAGDDGGLAGGALLSAVAAMAPPCSAERAVVFASS